MGVCAIAPQLGLVAIEKFMHYWNSVNLQNWEIQDGEKCINEITVWTNIAACVLNLNLNCTVI